MPHGGEDEYCKQAAPIAALTEAVKALTDSARRTEALQVEALGTLRTIAQQGEQINALTGRVDKVEQKLDKNLGELYPRVRVVEERTTTLVVFMENHNREDLATKVHALELAANNTATFITNYQRDETSNRSLNNTIKAGIIVAAVLAVVAFGLFVYAQSGYAPAPRSQQTRKG